MSVLVWYKNKYENQRVGHRFATTGLSYLTRDIGKLKQVEKKFKTFGWEHQMSHAWYDAGMVLMLYMHTACMNNRVYICMRVCTNMYVFRSQQVMWRGPEKVCAQGPSLSWSGPASPPKENPGYELGQETTSLINW